MSFFGHTCMIAACPKRSSLQVFGLILSKPLLFAMCNPFPSGGLMSFSFTKKDLPVFYLQFPDRKFILLAGLFPVHR